MTSYESHLPRCIGLIGYASAGKDAAAHALVPLGYHRIAFADPVREAALAINPLIPLQRRDLQHINFGPARWRPRYWLIFRPHWSLQDYVAQFGWDHAKKNPTVRSLLQRIGTEGGRDIHGDDCWVKIAQRRSLPIDRIVFTDVRFQNEIDLVRLYDGVLIRVDRPEVGPVNDHHSDTGIANLPYDYALMNNGTEERWAGEVRHLVTEIAKARFGNRNPRTR